MLPGLLLKVDGAPVALLLREMALAAREFLEQSTAWRQELAVTVPEGESEVDLAALLPEQSEVAVVLKVTSGAGKVWTCRMAGLQRLRLPWPAPAGGLPLTVLAALRPAGDAEGVPDDIAAQYRLAMEARALANLFCATNKPWGDAQQATLWLERADEYQTRARIEAIRGRVGGRAQASPAYVFGV